EFVVGFKRPVGDQNGHCGDVSCTPAAGRARRAATPARRRAGWPRIFVVGYSLPCDPPVGGHSCNGGIIPRFHRAAIGNGAYALTDSGRAALAAILEDVD